MMCWYYKRDNNLIQKKIVKMAHNLRWRKYIQSNLPIYWKLKIEVFFFLPCGSNLEFHHKYSSNDEMSWTCNDPSLCT